MCRLGLVHTLVTHTNMKGLGLTLLFRDRHGCMPPQLKTNKNNLVLNLELKLKLFGVLVPISLSKENLY